MGLLLEGLGKVAGRLGERGSAVSKAAEMGRGYLSRFGRQAEMASVHSASSGRVASVGAAINPKGRTVIATEMGDIMGRVGPDMKVGEAARFSGRMVSEARAAEGVRPTLFDQDTAKITRAKGKVEPTRRTNAPKTRTKNTAPRQTLFDQDTAKINRPPKASRTTTPSGTTQRNPPVTKQAPKNQKKGMPVGRTRKAPTASTKNPYGGVYGNPMAGSSAVPYNPVRPIASAPPGKTPAALAQNGKKIAQHVRNNKMRYAVGGGAVAVGGGAMMNRTGRGMDKNPGLNKGMYGR